MAVGQFTGGIDPVCVHKALRLIHSDRYQDELQLKSVSIRIGVGIGQCECTVNFVIR